MVYLEYRNRKWPTLSTGTGNGLVSSFILSSSICMSSTSSIGGSHEVVMVNSGGSGGSLGATDATLPAVVGLQDILQLV